MLHWMRHWDDIFKVFVVHYWGISAFWIYLHEAPANAISMSQTDWMGLLQPCDTFPVQHNRINSKYSF